MTTTKPRQRYNPDRRNFLGSCGSAAALACTAGSAMAATDTKPTSFNSSVLSDGNGKPISIADLKPGVEYIFQYPYRSTPCFLINLGETLAGGQQLAQANGQQYEWQGGVGPGQSIVAFSAICAHKLSHPSPVVSFIGYREYPVGFLNRETNEIEKRAGVIQCCSEHSIYDPRRGASVVSGPAPQPLAAIELQFREEQLIATGVYGGAMFTRYFEKFGNRLMLEHRSSTYADLIGDTTEVIAGDEYTKNKMRCG